MPKTDASSRFAVNLVYGTTEPYPEVMSKIAQAGFRGVMFALYEYDGGLEYEIDAAAEAAKRNGVRVVNVHIPYKRMREVWLDIPKREALLQRIFAFIDRAGRAGVPSLTVHPTSGPENVYVSALGAEAFEQICEKASVYGMDVCVENLRSPIHLDYLFEHVKAPNLKFCHDTGHNRVFNKEYDFARRYAPLLSFTHIHDNDEADDLHLIPGNGRIDFEKIRESYAYAGYTGVLCLELNWSPFIRASFGGTEAFLAAAYRALKERFGDR